MSAETMLAIRRCVEIAERLSTDWWTQYKHGEQRGDSRWEGMSDGAEEVAAAIRREFSVLEPQR